ncbi:MAG: Bax inhibitor-1/YccA family membrane protein [Acholeplasmataceae bacterium]
MRSSNPVFGNIERSASYASTAEQASYQGITIKTAFMLLLAAGTGFFAITSIDANLLITLLIPAFIVALISVMVATFVPRLAMPFAILYALAEGIILGLVTAIANWYAPGAAYTAIIGTATIFGVMLFLYSSRTIRVTSRFRTIMFSVLISILLVIITVTIINLVNPAIFAGASIGLMIGISVFLIIFGALMLALDFDRAESIVSSGADKRYEWVVALGLMVTLVWIYFEILRLILILSSRRS